MPAHFNEVIPNLYQIPLWGSSAFLLLEEQVTVIDAGWRGNGRRIVKHLGRLGRTSSEISHIISTHYHLDHIGGIAHLKNNSSGKVALHEFEVQYVQPGEGVGLPNPVHHPLLALCMSPLMSLLKPEGFSVDLPLEDGTQMGQLGGMNVVHTPGHTPGSISLHFPQAGLLMVGDALQVKNGLLMPPSRIFSQNWVQAINSLSVLTEYDFDIVCLSHFPHLPSNGKGAMVDLIERIGYEY